MVKIQKRASLRATQRRSIDSDNNVSGIADYIRAFSSILNCALHSDLLAGTGRSWTEILKGPSKMTAFMLVGRAMVEDSRGWTRALPIDGSGTCNPRHRV